MVNQVMHNLTVFGFGAAFGIFVLYMVKIAGQPVWEMIKKVGYNIWDDVKGVASGAVSKLKFW